MKLRLRQHAPAAAAAPAGTTSTETLSVPSGEVPTLEPAHTERRRVPRQTVQRSLLVVPVLPNGRPDWARRVQGATVDVSPTGVRLVFDWPDDLQVQELVLVLPGSGGGVRCTGLEIRHIETVAPGRVSVGAQVGGFADQLFRPENLTPTYQPQRGGFTLGLPQELLEAWSEVGILQPRVFDRVQVCPRCCGLPTHRHGCPNCGAAVALSQDQLVHHFACAYVGGLEEFQQADDLQCPKCRTRKLVINSDYEYLPGLHRCNDCHWSGDELLPVVQCLECRFRFPGDQAVEIELRGFHVDRLDPLALATAS